MSTMPTRYRLDIIPVLKSLKAYVEGNWPPLIVDCKTTYEPCLYKIPMRLCSEPVLNDQNNLDNSKI